MFTKISQLHDKRISAGFVVNVLLILFPILLMAQDTRHTSYPRLGCFNWGGATPEWCAQYDLLITADKGMATKAKAINPDMYIVYTRDWQYAAGLNVPNEWYVRNSQGQIVHVYNASYNLVDITDYCLASSAFGGKRYNEYITDWMTSLVDLNVFDGVATDGIVEYPTGEARIDIDLDRNGINDWTEHGQAWIQNTWEAGIHRATTLLRAAIGNDKLIFFNSSRLHEFERETTNGLFLEHQEYTAGSFPFYRREFSEWMSVAPNPHILHYGANRAPAINDYRYVRYHLTQALYGDAYFEATNSASGEHHWISYYDEYDLDLGKPTTDMYLLKNTPTWDGIWIRFFERGMVILSACPDQVEVTLADISGQAGYNGPYYHFKGSQDPVTNDGTLFDSFTFRGRKWSTGYMGDGLVLVNSPSVVAISDIVVDNGYQTTSPGSNPAELSGGAYQTSTETSGHWSSGAAGGTLQQYHAAVIPQGTNDAKAIFRPTINVPGVYEVFEWHGSLNSGIEVPNVRTRISFGDNSVAETSINQTADESQWNSLGSYYFKNAGDNYVELDQSDDGKIIADAVKFVYVGAENDVVPPNPPNQLQSGTRTEYTIELTWLPPVPASDGDVAAAYQIFRDGQLIKTTISPSFLDEDLEESTSYSYQVYSVDDFGHLSTQAAVLQVSTLADIVPPDFVSVITRSSTELELVFSEALEQSSVIQTGNYSIDNNINISSASLLENQSRVKLITSEHEIGASYQIQVSNIQDASKAHNAMLVPKTIPYEGATGDSILIKVSADNSYELYVNGVLTGSNSAWNVAQVYWIPCVAGKNVVAIKGIDLGGQAGLVAEIEFKGQHIVSNSTMWKVNKEEKNGWETITYDDSNWPSATSYGAHGTALPWSQYQNVSNISTTSDVQWIWSDDWELDDIVYFRLNLNQSNDSTPPATPSGFSEVIQVK